MTNPREKQWQPTDIFWKAWKSTRRSHLRWIVSVEIVMVKLVTAILKLLIIAQHQIDYKWQDIVCTIIGAACRF